MSYYYKYNFVSPAPIYATIKEELKSYMDTGAIDDLMFPTYTNKCLNKLGKGSYVISETALKIENFQARLPDNFYSVREAWLCAEIPLNSYRSPSSFYSQAFGSESIQIYPLTIGGKPCNNPQCQDPRCDGCMPEIIPAVYKTNYQIERHYKQSFLLKPGNISARDNCHFTYTENFNNNPYASTFDSFDIRDNKFVTNFREGIVHLIFYGTDYDDEGNQLIPDNYEIQEYIEAYIKYKMFETLSNQVNDETFKQIESKMMYYKREAEEAFVSALSEVRRETAYDKVRKIKKTLNRLDMYELPSSHRNYRRRY